VFGEKPSRIKIFPPRITMGLDGPGSNPGEGVIFRTRPDRPWGPHSPLTYMYGVITGDKADGAWR
jgi:hypothetical protein